MNMNLTPAAARAGLVGVLLFWAYFPTLRDLLDKWLNDPQYSHGILVPVFSLYLLYKNRDTAATEAKPWPWLGYGLMLVALACRAVAALLYFLPLDAVSLVLCLTGLVAVTGGKAALRRSWQSLVFLLFMIPLPYQVERMMGAELQNIATVCTTFLLQTLGQPAVAEGNVILINDIRLGVAEACSGLHMLVSFAAISVAAVMLLDRHWLVKALILASAIPIALITNILRITATGLAHVWLHGTAREGVLRGIHDFYGYLMPVAGLAFLLFELWVFRHLLLESKPNASIYPPSLMQG